MSYLGHIMYGFELITIALSVLAYTIIVGAILAIVYKIIKPNNPNANGLFFLLAFVLSIIAHYLFGYEIIPFFWF